MSLRSISLSPFDTIKRELGSLVNNRPVTLKKPLGEIIKSFEGPARTLSSEKIKLIRDSSSLALVARKAAHSFQEKMESRSIHLTPVHPSKFDRPSLSTLFEGLHNPTIQSVLKTMSQVMTIADESAKYIYPFSLDTQERKERYQLAKEIRFFERLVNKLKEFIGEEGQTPMHTNQFLILDELKNPSHLTLSSNALKKIRKDYEQPLIQLISHLNEKHYEAIVLMLEERPASEISQLQQSVHTARKISTKNWGDRVFNAMMTLGQLKQVHSEMMNVFEVAGSNRSLEEARKVFLTKELFHFVMEYPTLREGAQELSEKLAALKVRTSGRFTFAQLNALIDNTKLRQDVKNSFLKDLNAKMDRVDNFLTLADIVLQKDVQWFKGIKNENQVKICKHLFRATELNLSEATAILNDHAQLSEQHAEKLDQLLTQHISTYETLSKLLKEMAPQYWSLKEAAVQHALAEVSKSSRLAEIDPREWKQSIASPCKAYFAEVKRVLKAGAAITSELFAKQNEFLPRLMAAKRALSVVEIGLD